MSDGRYRQRRVSGWIEALFALAGAALLGYVGGMFVGSVLSLVMGLSYTFPDYVAWAGAVALPAYVVGKVWHDRREADRERIDHLTQEVERLRERERQSRQEPEIT
jgi:hypothetical protein